VESQAVSAAAPQCIAAAGDTATLLRSMDGSSTPLGSPESWSPALHTMVQVMLDYPLPMLLWWGPQFCQLYNDAFRSTVGAKHPRCFGQPASECWPEIWHSIGPLIEAPYRGANAIHAEDICIEIDRRGFKEQTHWTVAFSPVHDSSAPGGIGGVIGTLKETTNEVVERRRNQLLRDLAVRTVAAKSAEEFHAIAFETVAAHREVVPFALLYLISDDRKKALLTETAGVTMGQAESPLEIDLECEAGLRQPWPLSQTRGAAVGAQVVELRGRSNPSAHGQPANSRRSALIYPVRSFVTQQFAGWLILGISPRLIFDQSYRDFYDLLSRQIIALIANGRAFAVERQRAEASEDAEARARTELMSELTTMTRLHEFSTRLVTQTELPLILDEVLKATMALQHADLGCVQLYNRDQRSLELVAQRGFRANFLPQFRPAHDDNTICGQALMRRERVIVEDVLNDRLFEPQRFISASAGFRGAQSTPLFSRNGEPLGVISTYFHRPHRPVERDLRYSDMYARQAAELIERGRTESALRATEDRFRRYFELGLIGMGMTSSTKDFLQINDELCRILGYERSELIQHSWADLTHPDDVAADVAQFNRVLAGEIDGYSLDKRWIRKDGTVIASIIAVSCQRRADGSVDYFVKMVQDITDRKRAEQELRRNETYLAEAQYLSHTGSWGWDIASGKGVWSRETFRIFGIDPAEIEPSFDYFMQRIHPEDRRHVQQETARAARDGGDIRLEFRIVLPDGSVRHLESFGRPTLDESGHFGDEFNGAVMDVTELREAELKLRRLQSELAHVTRVTTMGQLATSIAHEMNQPLGAILNNVNACLRLLEDAPVQQEVRSALADIVNDAERASSVIARVRALARRSTPARALLNLNDVIADVLILTRRELAERGITLRTALADDLPRVVGDRVQLQQVILNLCMNAIDAMSEVSEERRVILIRTFGSELNGISESEVLVQDMGCGFPPEDAERLFEAFYSTKSSGIGMGLNLSRTIVEAHGGRIWAASDNQSGASFHCALPSEDRYVR
jgi:PAS domain S-box-containing protein